MMSWIANEHPATLILIVGGIITAISIIAAAVDGFEAYRRR